MRMMKGKRGLWMLGSVALGVLVLTGTSRAQERREVSTEIPGSVVVYPKVIWDGTRDTIIQIANTGNPVVLARCFYINAAPRNPTLPVSVTNPQQWVETDFDIVLTRQQPTHWVASAGRRTNSSDGFGTDGSGFDPGLIPPVPLGFRGELKCYQVDESGVPITGNKLKGEATLINRNGDVATYNAIAIPGNPDISGIQIGNSLDLDLTDSNPGEFAACPDTWIFNHFAYGTPDPAVTSLGACTTPGTCPVNTTLTMVPCSQDLENGIPGRVTVGFFIYDEFESRLSASTTVDCWFNLPLNQIAPAGSNNPFTPGALGGSTTRHTRIRPVPGQGGILALAEETRRGSSTVAGNETWAAFNLHFLGNRFDAATQGETDIPIPGVNATDHIVVPSE